MKKLLISITFLIVAINVNAQLDKDLIAYWPLDGNAQDISGNGHHGYFKSVNWLSDRGKHSSCVAFVDNNVSGIIISDDLSEIMKNSNFSLSFWFRKKPDATYSTGYPFRNECLTELGIHQSYFLFVGGKNIDISKEQWYHIVYAKASDSVRVYVNDTKVVSFIKTFSCLSGYGSQLADGLEGSLDDFRFYSRNLTHFDITQLYNLPSSCSTITGLEYTQSETPKILTKIVTPLGVEIKKGQAKSGILIYQYSDGSTKKVMNDD